ncbi:hypothetical protein BJ085DRAFT_30904 [Dimargaris cristalligena]|uniref:AB hydrolase-1 domain-containing protein n=1 Tax=Dimargaris cristalligena TaxID=215637 RepID=A0A4P9ZVL4_9FUNG|nr:hypothetical protein BJ085DRAFT_30904 [Dimargaris cristalligena]|eukprot:RKP37623.1 hypothetical protein BJ085DRAFT_30904 [Dimargaris cristalligena]
MEQLHGSKRLLLVFIHGFRGNDFTFQDFPERLRTVLTNSMPAFDVEAVIYPQYKTQGDLHQATLQFCAWLQDLVVQHRKESFEGEILIALVGHSMGGLLAPHRAAIIGLIAYDSPFYGVNASLWTDAALERATEVSQQVNQYLPALTTAVPALTSLWNLRPNASGTTATATAAAAGAGAARAATVAAPQQASRWGGMGKWGAIAVGGLVASAAAAAVTYSQRDQIQSGISYITSHLEFVGALVRPDQLAQRIQRVLALQPNVQFHCYYNELERRTTPPPSSSSSNPQGRNSGNGPRMASLTATRTFIGLPPAEAKPYFTPMPAEAKDEIDAHVSIFNPAVNSHYYALGDAAIKRLTEMIKRYAETKVQ